MAPPVLGFLIVAGGVVGLALVAKFVPSVWTPVASVVRRVLDIPIGLTPPPGPNLAEMYYRPYPARLQINWPALVLGPFWYLLAGLWVSALWVHFSIMATLVFVTGGVLAPVVWLYCGLKANEDLHEFRTARYNVY
jgi:hypothetical protein